MGNCIPGELCFVRLGLGVVCSLHRGVLAGARSQVSAAHCAETRLHFVTITGDLWGIGRDKQWWPPGDARKGTLDTFRLFAKSDKQTAVIYSVLGHCTGPPPCVSQAAVVTSAWPWLGEGVAAAVLADSSAPRSAAGAGAHHHAARLYYGDGDWSWKPGICCGCSYLLGPITGLMGRRIKHVFGLRSNTQYSGFLSCFCKVVLRNFWLAWSIFSEHL